MGGFSVLLYGFLAYLNRFNHEFQYKIDLIRDLVRVEPKLKPVKINTHGARLADFDDTRV